MLIFLTLFPQKTPLYAQSAADRSAVSVHLSRLPFYRRENHPHDWSECPASHLLGCCMFKLEFACEVSIPEKF